MAKKCRIKSKSTKKAIGIFLGSFSIAFLLMMTIMFPIFDEKETVVNKKIYNSSFNSLLTGDSWVIDGDTVYVNDELLFASATPHTIIGTSWVEFEFISKVYSGEVDFAWGFNTPTVQPLKVEIWENYEHFYNVNSFVEDEGSLTFYDVTDFTNLGIENFDNYNVDYGNDNNTYLFRVEHEPIGIKNFSIVAFSNYEINGDDYTVSGNYDKMVTTVESEYYYDWNTWDKDFDVINYVNGGMNKWYVLQGINVAEDVNYKIRAKIRSKVSTNDNSGKYWWAFKPSDEGIAEAIQNNHFYCLDPWYDSDFSYKKKITIDQNLFSSTVSNYPFLINITDDSDLFSHVTNDSGYDILFTDSTETTQFAHEVEYWNWDTGNSQVDAMIWVNVTSIAHDSDTEIYMYYGKSGASNQADPTGVWDSDYLAVWHMNGTWDSTGNGNDLSAGGSPALVADGIVGSCYDFENTENDHFDTNAVLNGATSEWTVFAFGQKESTDSGGYYVCTAGDDGNEAFQITITGSGDSPTNAGYAWVNSGGTSTDAASTEQMEVGSWFMWSTVYNNNDDVVEQWSNGRVQTDTPVGAWGGCSNTVNIGAYNEGSGNDFDGMIDEVRISNVDRGINWIRATTNMILNSSSYQTWAAEETGSSTVSLSPDTVTWSGEQNDVVWCNNTGSSDDTIEATISIGGDTCDAIRFNISDLSTVTADNIEIVFSSDNSTWAGDDGSINSTAFSSGGSNITITNQSNMFTQWTEANGCYGSTPFTNDNALTGEVTIYIRLKLVIPGDQNQGTYTDNGWRFEIGSL